MQQAEKTLPLAFRFLVTMKSYRATNSKFYFAKLGFKPLFHQFLELRQNSAFKSMFGKAALLHSLFHFTYSSPFQLCSALTCVDHFRAVKHPQ